MIGKDAMNSIFGRYVNGHGAYIPGTALLVKTKITLLGFIEMYGM